MGSQTVVATALMLSIFCFAGLIVQRIILVQKQTFGVCGAGFYRPNALHVIHPAASNRWR